MSSLQLLKTPSGRHPFLSRWSKNEPASSIMTDPGNSDHWSKLKHRAAILTLKFGDGDTGVAFWSDNEPYKEPSQSRSQLLQREHQYNNRLSSIGSETFTEIMIRSLDGEKPGHHTRYKDSKRNVLRSTANDRAREGFRYWVLDKPVHKGGKYTTGARTSFLGLGKSFYP